MNGREFLKKAKRYAKDNGLDYRFDESRGKGSHGTVYVGTRRTTVKDRKKEIYQGLYLSMLADLGIDPSQF